MSIDFLSFYIYLSPDSPGNTVFTDYDGRTDIQGIEDLGGKNLVLRLILSPFPGRSRYYLNVAPGTSSIGYSPGSGTGGVIEP